VPWLDWLSEKVKNDRSMSEGKPKEFRRALTGKPHSLSKPDLNRILEGNEIIPEKILHAEVIHRAHSWVLDTSGRRDFSHLLNIEMRKWEMKRKMEMKLQVSHKYYIYLFMYIHMLYIDVYMYIYTYMLYIYTCIYVESHISHGIYTTYIITG
jgi:hypothetical protein